MMGLAAGAVAVLGHSGRRDAAQADEAPAPPAIDTHIHFFHPDPSVNASPATPPEKKPILPADWRRVANPCGVTQAIVIESSPDIEDNQRLLDLAARHPWIVGIVGQLPIGEEGCSRLIDRFAAHERFRGIRVNSDALLTGLDNAAYTADLERLAAKGLVVDVIGPTRIVAADRLAARLPEMRVLIEHMAGATIDHDRPDPRWLDGIAAAAKRPNIFLKVSHVIQSAARDAEQPGLDRYLPWLSAVWDAFGDARVMFGTDWPVSQRHASYARIHDLARQFMAGKGEEAGRRFFTDNARIAYGLSSSPA